MASSRILILFLLFPFLVACNSKDKEVEIYHMPPDYFYENNWHGDTAQFTYTAWYALKYFYFDNSTDLAKLDSLVYSKYPIKEKGRSIVTCVHFFEYSSKSNESTEHSQSSDRSLEIDYGRRTLVIYCYDERDITPKWNRTLYIDDKNE